MLALPCRPASPMFPGHLALPTTSFPTAPRTHPNLGLWCCESLM